MQRPTSATASRGTVVADGLQGYGFPANPWYLPFPEPRDERRAR